MKKKLIITAMLMASVSVNAQLGKNLESKLSGTATDELNVLPKGMNAYSDVHADAAGISGVYYAKYPVQFMYVTTMGGYKTFSVDQLTFEFDEEMFAGRVHVVEDAVAKAVRNAGTELSTTWDIYGGGLGDVQKGVAKTYDFYAFNTNFKNYIFGSVMGVSKKAGLRDGMLYRTVEDKDILVFGSCYGGKANENQSQYSIGGNYNVFSKDKSKLEDWDSTKIFAELHRYEVMNKDYVSKSLGSRVDLPKLAINDDAREKEYAALIQPMAAQDKPIAWGDKFVYCYINTDWKEESKGGYVTHRWCTVIAVSKGWTDGSDGRYIPCLIKQAWDGTKFGPSVFSGFQGALVPVSSETIDAFKH